MVLRRLHLNAPCTLALGETITDNQFGFTLAVPTGYIIVVGLIVRKRRRSA